MSNQFHEIWKDQFDFNNLILPCTPEEMTPEQRQYWHEKYTLLLNKELMEVLDETEFKPHRKIQGKMVRSNLMEELVDVFKYWMCLCQVHNVNSHEIIEEYYRKSNVVRQRYYQEKVLKYEGKIIGVDIDGVLADYPRSFIEYVNQQLGLNIDYRTIRGYDMKEYAKEMEIPIAIIKKLKHEYRDSGQKRFIPVIDGAKQFLEELKSMGYIIVLLTSRPVHIYKRMFADTQYWLTTNKLPYDAILFDENKGDRLVKEFGKEKIKFFVDDVANFANNISDNGMRCYLISKPYNRAHGVGENVIRVDTLWEVLSKERGIKND